MSETYTFSYRGGVNVYDAEWRYLACAEYVRLPAMLALKVNRRHGYMVREFGPNGPCYPTKDEAIAAIRRILE